MKGVFVTGSGTDIGKTYLACRLVEALRAAGTQVDALKPILTGFDPAAPEESDPAKLAAALGTPLDAAALERLAPFRFRAPLSPHMAAAREGRALTVAELAAASRARLSPGRLCIVEGAGGVMVPLNARETTLDLMAALGLPCLLVAGSYLGALSHGLTAARCLAGAGLRLAALVVNESPGSDVPLTETAASFADALEGVPVRALPRGAGPDAPVIEELSRTFLEHAFFAQPRT
ncbi:MAG: dethiobiotin synthase [Alphaproteobacteria bacterium]|nr:dethiobiotin synthase [Alphaproteobacteria bacterium]